MKVLFVGGTGITSSACTKLAVARGMEVWVLNRSRSPGIEGTRQIVADLTDIAAARAAVGDSKWDVVVDFLGFTAEHVEQRIELFRGRTAQYIFISSASAYQKPQSHYIVTESTPLANPYWVYARHKIAGEERLMRALREEAFPVTIVRPTLTYGPTLIPLAINSWTRSYTAVARMRQGKPLPVPGDGLALWTITHNSDLAKGVVGLIGHRGAIGQAFHITTDEVLTWNQIYQLTAEAAGVAEPKLVHIASDFLIACDPKQAGPLLGSKASCAIFDNTKIKTFVPDFAATMRFRDGIRETLAWFDADPARRLIDEAMDADWDRLIAAYEKGCELARQEYAAASPGAVAGRGA